MGMLIYVWVCGRGVGFADREANMDTMSEQIFPFLIFWHYPWVTYTVLPLFRKATL